MCWAGGVSTLELGSLVSKLVYLYSSSDGSTDTLRTSDDRGYRVERMFAGPANPNGDAGGVYWKVTTTDGTQYFFGRQNPGWSASANNSTLTEPMYAQSSADVCWGNTFTDNAGGTHSNACRIGYRWNLSYVVDPSGNLQTWQYSKEQSSYALSSSAKAQLYDAAGYLTSVSYGLTTSNALTVKAPQQISLAYGWRCDFAGCRAPVPNDSYAADYPDTPLDLWCLSTAATCSSGPTSPAFFYRSKLESVTSGYYNGSGYTPVEKVALDVGWPKFNGWSWSAVMWLRTITKTGYSASGASLALPAVSFSGDYDPWLANRWDDTPVSGWHQEKPRITAVYNELGGVARVTYGQPNACGSQTLAGNEDRQTTDCYPSFEPDGHEAWFRRYLVTRLDVVDAYGAATQTTTYTYDTATGAGWHSDNDPVLPKAQQLWSDYRGYWKMTITSGTPGGTTTSVEKRAFRGLNLDHKADGSAPAVTLSTKSGLGDSTSGVSYTDDFFLRGLPLEERVLHADGSEDSATQHEYTFTWVADADYGPWGLYEDSVVQARENLTRNMITSGGVVRRYKKITHSAYDPAYGLPVSVQNDGDPVSGTGPTCDYVTYTRNTSAWIVDTEATKLTAAGSCPSNGSAPSTGLIARTDTYYDANFTTLTASPTAGLTTKMVNWASANGTSDASARVSATSYDAYGHVTGVISPDNFVPGATSFATAGKAATTSYTMSNGVLTGVTATNEAGMTASQTLDPGTGQSLTSTDQNGRTTTLTYDALGRLTNVRLPGDSYDVKTIAYTISATTPSVVVTSAYPAAGASRVQSWQFYDSLARPYQSQVTGPSGGTITTGVRYDDRGNTAATVSALASAAAPGTVYGQWYAASFTATLPSQTVTTFDDLSRPVTASLVAAGTTQWTAATAYDGTTTTVTPPSNSGASEPGIAATMVTKDMDGHVLTRAQGGNTTSYGYDIAGRQVKITSPKGAVTSYGYDWLGRRTSTSDPDAGASTADYYPSGALKHTRDATGKELFTSLDALDRPTATYIGSSASGTLLSKTIYDATPLGGSSALLGTITSQTRYDNASAYTLAYGYDTRYRTVRADQTIPAVPGSPIQYLAGTYTTTMTYDGLNRPAAVTYPAAGGLAAETVTTGYSGAYPATLTSPLAAYVSATSYTGTGQVASRILGIDGATGSVKASNTWDTATGRLTAQAAATPSTGSTANVQSDAYTYTPGGDLSKITDQVAGQQQCYTYDTLDRLVAAATSASSAAAGNACTADSTGPTPYTQAYAYDPDGDLTSLTSAGVTSTFGYGTNTTLGVTGGPHAPTSVTKNGTTSTYSYDASGQLTSKTSSGVTTSYTWNAAHRLTTTTSGTSTSTFTDGADATRWIRTTPTETVAYLAGQELHLPAGSTTASAATAVRYYTLGRTVAERTTGTSTGLYWLLGDRQGSVSIVVNATTATLTRDRYLPYGGNRATTFTVPTDRGWIGQIQDKDTGLDYLNARYYDPTLAHFISTDPLNDQTSPEAANPYSYAAANPILFSDPSGAYVPKDDMTMAESKLANETAARTAIHQSTTLRGHTNPGGTYTVGTGEDWNTVARISGLNFNQLRSINGGSLAALHTGQIVHITLPRASSASVTASRGSASAGVSSSQPVTSGGAGGDTGFNPWSLTCGNGNSSSNGACTESNKASTAAGTAAGGIAGAGVAGRHVSLAPWEETLEPLTALARSRVMTYGGRALVGVGFVASAWGSYITARENGQSWETGVATGTVVASTDTVVGVALGWAGTAGGAALGSIAAPGVGTVVGGVLGGMAGSIGGAVASNYMNNWIQRPLETFFSG
jgi:RHS repeat-associated protein